MINDENDERDAVPFMYHLSPMPVAKPRVVATQKNHVVKTVSGEEQQRIKKLFHALWSSHSEAGYRHEVKQQWNELQRLLQDCGVDV